SGVQHDGGVYQTITVTPGAHYRITAKMKRALAGSIQHMSFGYDLTGGTAGDGASVVYKSLTPVLRNHWAEYEAVVTATGPQITLFARGGITANGSSNNRTQVDYVVV